MLIGYSLIGERNVQYFQQNRWKRYTYGW